MSRIVSRADIFSETLRNLLSPVAHLLSDDGVSEILINGPNSIYCERGGRLRLESKASFEDEVALLAAVRNIVQFVGKRISEREPMVDARLPDGSRIHVLVPPASRSGVIVSIRKFQKSVLSAEKLVELGSLSRQILKFLEICIAAGKTILISGGTGTGKTSLLNVLGSMIPHEQRIIVIEDSSELQLQGVKHVIYTEARPADRYGRGEVTIHDLFRSALRLRPDRIVIGEVRGGEAYDLLQALTSGHGGSLCTLHANRPLEALERLEAMTLESGMRIPQNVIRGKVAAAIDVVVQVSRFHDGKRRVTEVAEALPARSSEFQVAPLYGYRRAPDGMGTFQPLGRPTFFDELRATGLGTAEQMESLFR